MVSSSLVRVSRQLALRAATRPSAAAAMRFESTSDPKNKRFYSSTMHENDPETLEREKHRNLTGKQNKTSTPHEHAPGWNEYLASASEAAVKADRSEGGPDVLQKKTTERLRARHEAEEDDLTDRNTRSGPEFHKEDVKGPLGSAKGEVAHPEDRTEGVSGGKP